MLNILEKLPANLIVTPQKGFIQKSQSTLQNLKPKFSVAIEDKVESTGIGKSQFRTFKWDQSLNLTLLERHFVNDVEIRFEVYDQQNDKILSIGSNSIRLSALKEKQSQEITITLLDEYGLITGTVDILFNLNFYDEKKPKQPEEKKESPEIKKNEDINKDILEAIIDGEIPKKETTPEKVNKSGIEHKDDDNKKDVLKLKLEEMMKIVNKEPLTDKDKTAPQNTLPTNKERSKIEIDLADLKPNESLSSPKKDETLPISNKAYIPDVNNNLLGTIILRPIKIIVLNTSLYATLLNKECKLIVKYNKKSYESIGFITPDNPLIFKDIFAFTYAEHEDIHIKCVSNHPDLPIIGECKVETGNILDPNLGPKILQVIIEGDYAVHLDLKFEVEFLPEIFEAPVKVYHPIELKPSTSKSKQIKYFNPTPYEKTIKVLSQNNSLIQPRTELLKLPANGEGILKFKFFCPESGEVRCRIDTVLINENESNIVEESLLFKLKAI